MFSYSILIFFCCIFYFKSLSTTKFNLNHDNLMQFCVSTFEKYFIIQFQGGILILSNLYVLRIWSIANIYNFFG